MSRREFDQLVNQEVYVAVDKVANVGLLLQLVLLDGE